jgi:hypothetical protein
MNTNGTALAEGLYWYAEKLLWGYGRWNRTSAFGTLRTWRDVRLESVMRSIADID